MTQKVIKTGNSLAVTVPSSFAKSLGLKIGSDVTVEAYPETGQLTYTFTGANQLTLSGLALSSKKL